MQYSMMHAHAACASNARRTTHLALLALGDPGDHEAGRGALLGVGVHQRLQHVLEGRRVMWQKQLALPQVMERLASCTFA